MYDSAVALRKPMQKIKCCAIIGATGKMGSLASRALEEANIQVLPVSRKCCLIESAQKNPCVALELSNRESVFANSQEIVQQAIPLVIGASGLTDAQKALLNQNAVQQNIPVWVIPNFSIAAVIMVQASQRIAQYIPSCEIIEYHHEQKQDAPSATSIDTAKKISQVQASHKKYIAETAHYVVKGKIPIHSLRTPGVVARQDVVFAQAGESLTLSLSQIDRKAFMPGIVLAINKVRTLSAGLHEGLALGL